MKMFKDILQEKKSPSDVQDEEILDEAKDNGSEVQKILRAHGYKIKLVTDTSFGTQIDLAKKYPESELKKLLKGYDLKFKGKALFVMD